MALQVWLPLRGDLNNYGLSDVTVTNSDATVDNNGKIGKCYSFDSNSYLKESNFDWTNFNVNQFSLCCWYNEPSVASGNSQIICIGTNSGWNNIRIGLLRRTSNGYPMFSVSDGTNNVNYNFTATTFPLNVWNHIAVTYDSGKLKMYINGILNKEGTTTIVPVLNSSQHLGIGAASNGAEKLLGYLNDVRIYDHCLSPKEVKEISQGLVLHYKLDNLINNNHNLPSGYQELEYIESTGSSYFDTGVKFNPETESCTVIFKGNDLSNNGMIFASNGAKYFWFYYYSSSGIRVYANNGSAQQGVSGYLARDTEKHTMRWNNKHYFIDDVDKGTLSNTYGETTNNIWLFSYGGNNYPFKGRIYYTDIKNSNDTYKRIFIPAKRISDSVVGMYDLIERTFYVSSSSTGFTAGSVVQNTIIHDSSGYGNNGTITGTLSITNNTGRYNYSLDFNGSSFIKSNDLNLNNTSNFTISSWINIISSQSYQPIFWLGNGTATQGICVHGPTSNRLEGGNGTNKFDNTLSAINLNSWTHVVITYDGTTIKRYINGVLNGSISFSYLFGNTFVRMYIGYFWGGKFKGNISDFRLYSTTLSAEDILQLYQVNASIDNGGNIISNEFEEEYTSKQQILKTGVVKIDNFLEINDKLKVLSDGSVFLQILHHNAPASNLFTANNCWLNNGTNLYSALILLKNASWLQPDYEFLVCEKLESSSTESQIRWKQTSNPAIDTTPSGFQLISGSSSYLSPGLVANTGHGCFDMNGDSWWCCCGCYTAYQGGIPGFTGTVKTGYLDLYIKIPNEMIKGNIADFVKFYAKSILTNQLIEK